MKKHFYLTLLALICLTGCVEEIDTSNRYTFTGETVGSFLEKNEDLYGDFNYMLRRTGLMSMVYPEDGNVVYSSSDRKISFDVASHFGLGFAHVTSEDFIPWKWHSGEFFLNLFKFKFAPCSWGGIEAGLDLGFISIRSASNAFYLDDKAYKRTAPSSSTPFGRARNWSRISPSA